MIYIDQSLDNPALDLAFDEALLDLADRGGSPPVLRVWEPSRPFVVMGYANRWRSEVDVAACRACDVPVFRRRSGGGTVLQAAGCLNYAVILPAGAAGPLVGIADTNRRVLERHRGALGRLIGRPVAIRGDTDLVVDDRKFSGNAQRRGRRFVLMHGTFLLAMRFDVLDRFLPLPARRPAYRRDRPHADFLTNLSLQPGLVKDALREAWGASRQPFHAPLAEAARLAEERYTRSDWTRRF